MSKIEKQVVNYGFVLLPAGMDLLLAEKERRLKNDSADSAD
jgi:hypothetical protein